MWSTLPRSTTFLSSATSPRRNPSQAEWSRLAFRPVCLRLSRTLRPRTRRHAPAEDLQFNYPAQTRTITQQEMPPIPRPSCPLASLRHSPTKRWSRSTCPAGRSIRPPARTFSSSRSCPCSQSRSRSRFPHGRQDGVGAVPGLGRGHARGLRAQLDASRFACGPPAGRARGAHQHRGRGARAQDVCE